MTDASCTADDGNRAGIEDVAQYLTLHDENASARQIRTSSWTAAEVLKKAFVEAEAELIVSGGYGYSRVRESFFGGGPRELMAVASVCGLIRH